MPSGQRSWPKVYQEEVGLRLKALVLAIAEIEGKSVRKILEDIEIPDNRWANCYKGKRPVDGYDCAIFTDTYGGTTDWVFRGRLTSIPEPNIRDLTNKYYRSLQARKRGLHAA